MKYTSKESAQQDHINNYRSDGVAKMKGSRYSSDKYRVYFLLSEVPEKSYVLDVGCNGGTVAMPLMALKKCYVKGIDIVPELVDAAKKRGVFAEIGEAEDLSRFKDGEFDCVICSEVLEHLFDPMPAIKEAHRVLKDGGKYIVTVPHPSGFMCKDGKLGDYHQTNFTLEILDTIFHNVFQHGEVTFIEIPYLLEYCLSNRIDPKMPQWLGIVGIKGGVTPIENLNTNKNDINDQILL